MLIRYTVTIDCMRRNSSGDSGENPYQPTQTKIYFLLLSLGTGDPKGAAGIRKQTGSHVLPFCVSLFISWGLWYDAGVTRSMRLGWAEDWRAAGTQVWRNTLDSKREGTADTSQQSDLSFSSSCHTQTDRMIVWQLSKPYLPPAQRDSISMETEWPVH